MTVPAIVEIYDTSPSNSYHEQLLEAADHVVECSIELSSGILLILGNVYLSEAPRIFVSPGNYQVRIYYIGLSTISEDGLDGDDKYQAIFWGGNHLDTKILKRYVPRL